MLRRAERNPQRYVRTIVSDLTTEETERRHFIQIRNSSFARSWLAEVCRKNNRKLDEMENLSQLARVQYHQIITAGSSPKRHPD